MGGVCWWSGAGDAAAVLRKEGVRDGNQLPDRDGQGDRLLATAVTAVDDGRLAAVVENAVIGHQAIAGVAGARRRLANRARSRASTHRPRQRSGWWYSSSVLPAAAQMVMACDGMRVR